MTLTTLGDGRREQHRAARPAALEQRSALGEREFVAIAVTVGGIAPVMPGIVAWHDLPVDLSLNGPELLSAFRRELGRHRIGCAVEAFPRVVGTEADEAAGRHHGGAGPYPIGGRRPMPGDRRCHHRHGDEKTRPSTHEPETISLVSQEDRLAPADF